MFSIMPKKYHTNIHWGDVPMYIVKHVFQLFMEHFSACISVIIVLEISCKKKILV